ncbi:winged helix-turn-helix domain-containing protein [Streptomyces sp. NBC_00390]|uniref:helix-turn-helix domain-containing protein n=1 Tax=Streptomyces sp. NBC_00390 TaxID=2975736 RepID=UPI002E1F5C57
MGKYLKRWGLTFQRPDKRAVEQDPEAVRLWHEVTPHNQDQPLIGQTPELDCSIM